MGSGSGGAYCRQGIRALDVVEEQIEKFTELLQSRHIVSNRPEDIMQNKTAFVYQKGMTPVQIVVGLAIIGFVLASVLKVVPVYIDNHWVRESLKTLGESPRLNEMEKEQIVKNLKTAFDLNGVRGEAAKSIKIYQRAEGWLINIDYEERIPFWGNLDVVVHFENQLNAAKPNDCCEKLIADVEK